MSDPQSKMASDEPMPDVQEEYYQEIDPEKITIVSLLHFGFYS